MTGSTASRRIRSADRSALFALVAWTAAALHDVKHGNVKQSDDHWIEKLRRLSAAAIVGPRRQIADLDGWPNWYEGTEFRAIRDSSRAGE